MMLPAYVLDPPFDVTRASHAVLTVRDLGASRAFYADVLGFIVSAETADVLYLRGIEERGHHSLVLRRSAAAPAALRLGFHVRTEADIEEAERYFAKIGRPTKRADLAYQGPTLHVDDAIGTPLEFCASMSPVPMLLQQFQHYRGGSPLRLDHFQVAAQDVARVTDFYAALGFRLSEYTAADGTDQLWGSWLQRKGNPHDIVFTNGVGPRLHHFAYTVPESRDIIHVCDRAAALGAASRLERGPGRHGIGNALFVYFRDPDGHRVELFTSHYQDLDLEQKPLRWDLSDTRRSQLWGLPATAKWFCEASNFAGVEPVEPTLRADPITLERFLATL